MLGIMRKYKESIVIKVVFIVIVASFIGTIFLVWGKGGGGPSGGKSYAAKVNGKTISLEEYQQAYYRLRNIYEQLLGSSLTPDAEKGMGLKKQALDNLVEQYLVAQAARSMNISVSKDEIAAAIAANPSFQTNGAFDFSLYQKILASNRITPKDYEENQKLDLMIKKARQSITDKVAVTDEEALAHYHKKNDRISLTAVIFDPTAAGREATITDADLTAYIQANGKEFQTPEKIAVQYLLLDPATVASKAAPTDDEIQSYYQKNIDRYQGKDGILPLADVKERVKRDATRFKAGKIAYEMAADALNRNLAANDLAAAARSLSIPVTQTKPFTLASPPPEFSNEPELVKRLFTFKTGELSGPIETPKGIYLVKITERTPPAVPPLKEIRSQVEARVRAVKGGELAKKKAEDFLASLAKNGPTPVGAITTGLFGYDEKGVIPGVGTSKELMDSAFTLTKSSPLPSAPLPLNGRWIVVKLAERVEADRGEFEKQKDGIKKELLPKKQQQALDSWVKELKSKAKIEINEAIITY